MRHFSLIFTSLSATLLLAAACSSSPEVAGDACELDGDPCPAGTACVANAEGDLICQILPGGACDPAGEDLCRGDDICLPADGGGGLCGTPEGGECDPANDFCAGALACAEKADGTHACFPPVNISGKVFDAETDGAIAGALVIAFDDSSTAVSDVAVTDAAGAYTLEVPAARDANGVPTSDAIFTLSASAADYLTFPGGVRTALPVDASSAAKEGDGYSIVTPLTDIALIGLPSAQQGLASISGTVEAGDLSAGVLVVAESSGDAYTAVADKAGDYTIFNVPDGSYTVMGYGSGVQLSTESADVASKDLNGVDLSDSGEALGIISGSVNIVNAPGGAKTSVVLVVASTYDDTFVRGEVPRGLRAPLSGPPTVDGAFTIEGVPEGSYVVLASFENDDLVLDPDPNISGTQIVTVDMPRPGKDVTLDSSFKVTEALEVLSPGKDDPEAVGATPTFKWVDDSSESFYTVQVFDSFGNQIWEDDMVPGVSGGDVSVPYAGPALEAGLYYQFRATSWKQSGNKPAGPISQTENLRGVFFLE